MKRAGAGRKAKRLIIATQTSEKRSAEMTPGGARMGSALLMAPDRPLPVVSFVKLAATPRSERRRGDQRGRPGPGASRPAFRSVPQTRGPRPGFSVLLLEGAVNPDVRLDSVAPRSGESTRAAPA